MAADRTARSGRPGFSLAEVIVTIAILALLATVVVRSTSGVADRERVKESIETLERLSFAIFRFDLVVARFPRRITHLHTRITGSPETSICSAVTYTSSQQSTWETHPFGGPFWEYPTAASGFPIPIGMVSDTMVRSPLIAINTARSFGILQIVVREVSDDDVVEMNLLVDRDGSSTQGAIRWTPDGAGANTMTWNIPIAGC